jgi:DNA-directed RNA polymerase specialized sigma24 family protein
VTTEGVYDAHLRTFLAAADEPDPARRVATAAQALELLDGLSHDWSALLDLAVTELYAGGMSQGDIAAMLGVTRQMVSLRVARGRHDARSLRRIVAAARRAAGRGRG